LNQVEFVLKIWLNQNVIHLARGS